jgi:hypothetical protein
MKHIEEQYAGLRESADVYRDQEMARLFGECGWTQEKIAAKLGRRQSRVSQMLCFGRFLDFITSGDTHANLTERRFREHWNRTSGKEADRFAQVAHVLEHGIPHGIEAMIDKPGISAAVVECLQDGKWYTIKQITATVEESLIGVTENQVTGSVRAIRRTPPAGKKIEAKPIGRMHQYRMVKRKGGGSATPIEEATLEIYEQVQPFIEQLRHWGNSSRWEQAPSALLQIAERLERLFEARLSKVKT